MPKTYEDAPVELTTTIIDARQMWHPVLDRCEVTASALLEADYDKDSGELCSSLVVGGYPAAAMVKITPLRDRALGVADAVIVVDARWWADHPDELERRALIDHELTHLEVCSDPAGRVTIDGDGELVGKPVSDDRGRPKLRIRKHDFVIGGFIEVARRHKQRAVEVQQVEMLQNSLGQWAWDFPAVALAPAAE
jgi:Putative phage metallopeptidase